MSLTAVFFVLVFFGAILLTFTRGPIFGVLAYMWTFYNHPPSRWWGESLPDLRWSLLAAAATLLALIMNGRTSSPNANAGPSRDR